MLLPHFEPKHDFPMGILAARACPAFLVHSGRFNRAAHVDSISAKSGNFPAQGPSISAKGADAGRVWGGQMTPPPSKSYYGRPKCPRAPGL